MAKKKQGSGGLPKLVSKQDPDNPNTTILSRWPTEEEKGNFPAEASDDEHDSTESSARQGENN